MSEPANDTASKIAPASKPPIYATAEQIRAYRSPEPLQKDYTHTDTNQTFRIEGISRVADRKPIMDEQDVLLEASEGLEKIVGYKPDVLTLRDAAFCSVCITAPKLTALEWLQFGAEADLWELGRQCLIACRMLPDQADKDADKLIPDGVEAAENALKSDPLETATP